jgi:hypothetical protein
MSAQPVWCSNKALTSCQSRRTSTYKYPKLTAAAEVVGVAAYRSFYITQAGNTAGARTISITFNGEEVASLEVDYNNNSKNNRNDLASKVVAAINGSGTFVAEITRTDSGKNTCSTSSTCAQIKVTAPGERIHNKRRLQQQELQSFRANRNRLHQCQWQSRQWR